MQLTINNHNGKREIPIYLIEYLAGAGTYTVIHILGERPMLVSKSLGFLANQLPDFVRVHKQTLVNPAHITNYQLRKYSDSVVILSGNRLLTVSRRRAKLVYDQLCKP